MHTRNDHGTRESVPAFNARQTLALVDKFVISPCVLLLRIKYSHTFFHLCPGHEIYSHGSFVSAGTLLRSQIDEQSPVRNTPGIVYFPDCMFFYLHSLLFLFVLLCHFRYVSCLLHL